MDASNSASCFARHEFLIRRLHSLSGLVPVGAFLCVHLLTNSSVLGGGAMFQRNVDLIHSLGPILPLVEWVFIFLPILFHAVVGVVIIRSGQSNASVYGYGKNVRYTLQRATAWIALFFIAWHVFHMHGWIHHEWWLRSVAEPAFGAQFSPEAATSSASLALRPIVVKLLYAVGVLASVFHFANGLWTMGITWGLWTSPAAQRRADYACAALGILLGLAGLGSLAGFTSVDLRQTLAQEEIRLDHRLADLKRQVELAGPSPTVEAEIEHLEAELERVRQHRTAGQAGAPPTPPAAHAAGGGPAGR